MEKGQEQQGGGPGLMIVSNRLPVVMSWDEASGTWDVEPGSGGLVQAMNPILKQHGGTWVGWLGMTSEEAGEVPPPLGRVSERTGYRLAPVSLSTADIEGYYTGFANSVLWPLFHGFPDRCEFRPEFWESYKAVNETFAAVLAEEVAPGEPLWVHDYHLILTAQRMREMGAKPGRVGFFLHIPFPVLENFLKLPWRADLMRAMLQFDQLGFQTGRDLRNFLSCVEKLVPEARIERQSGHRIKRIATPERELSVAAFPIGNDFAGWDERARSEAVEAEMLGLREALGEVQILLGIDRLDYSKGLLSRLQAFELMLDEHPELQGQVMLFQLVVPSRESVPEYQLLKEELEREIGRITGRFSRPGWQPIRYLYNTVDLDELTALYRMSRVAVVTPLCDGMNLVCKEFCASQIDANGALLLSEFAGAAAQLQEGAVLVNPYDVERTAAALHQAVTMGSEERQERMTQMRSVLQEQDVFWWSRSFIQSLLQPRSLQEMSDAEYLPTIDVPA